MGLIIHLLNKHFINIQLIWNIKIIVIPQIGLFKCVLSLTSSVISGSWVYKRFQRAPIATKIVL